MAAALAHSIPGLLRCRASVGSCRLNCRGLLAGLPSSPSLGAVMQRAADVGGPFDSLRFDNLALRALPVEPGSGEGEEARRSRQVPGACFSRVRPIPVERPRVVALSAPALALLGLEVSELQEKEAALNLSGCRLPAGAEPAAHCYCGHQFGSFAGQLGDGAAMYLGEVLNQQGERWEIQLKGAGVTPFSRQSDGRKVLRSSIREFLCSEAMFHLGIPTTRAGSCVTSDSKVVRDIFYDGNPKHEQCTIVLRIAATFLRFGSFEIFKPTDEYTGRKGPSVDRNDIRVKMLDYVIGTFYPEIQEAHPSDSIKRNAAFFKEITQRTAKLVAEWQCVGFCHGVLNTDNMSIVGLTIDYGPFGFMDRYDPDHVCNGSDNMGRYTYIKQPEICKWNLGKLAEALVPELPLEVSNSIIEETFDATYENHYLQKMRNKLGLLQLELEDDKNLVLDLLKTMNITGADFTNLFRLLSSFSADPAEMDNFLQNIVEECASLEELKLIYKPKMDPRQLSMMIMLAQSNPELFEFIGSKTNINKELEYVERHSKLQKITVDELNNETKSHWKKWLQKYSSRLEREVDGVTDVESLHSERMKIMDSNNPKYILRNYIAQNAIDAAENGDFAEVRRVLTILENPFQDSECLLEQQEVKSSEAENAAISAGACSSAERRPMYSSKPPVWATELCVT